MFEKLGLPPKPSLKGHEWVLDASHCQSCSSAFTFFNRKHHCRRCGGIFCGSCTQQRVFLRGQGEGPVRICDPCKKLEDAARLESRSGYRHKVSKGATKASLSVDSHPLLKELLGQDLNRQDEENVTDEVSKFIASKHAGSTSAGDTNNAENNGSVSAHVTPELLLEQANEQKQQWLALKKEGKGDEALQAFKRSKELERQAENLKLSIRRKQRKAATSITRKEKHEEISKPEPEPKTCAAGSEDALGGPGNSVPQAKIKKGAFKEVKEKKDDLMVALKELGWNDEDLQDAGAKQNKAKTVESELAELTAAVHHDSGNNHQKNTSSMEVLAHRRKALALKREGHLAEAKEELKKAKILEKHLEEQQLLGDEEDESDDDLRALIHEMNKQDGSHGMDAMDMDVSILSNIHEEDDQGYEVTDVDMDDPDMIAALKSMGWEDEGTQIKQVHHRTPVNPKNTGHFHKPQGAPEDLDFLGGFETNLHEAEATEDDMKDPYLISALKAMGFEEEEPSKLMHPLLPSAEDRRRLQQEILFLKKEALALKRVGKLGEAKEELRRAKHLEKQLQEVKSQYTDDDVLDAFSLRQAEAYHGSKAEAIILQETLEDTVNVDVTEEDMGDPELAKTLKALGWQDDHESDGCVATEVDPSEEEFRVSHNSKSKSELQKELLGVKRAALKLRREGKLQEAEDELKRAHLIEQLMEESGRVSIVKETNPTDQELFLLIERKVQVDAEEIIMEDSHRGGHANEKDSSGFSLLPKNRIERVERSSSATYDKADAFFMNTGRERDYGLEEQRMQLSKVGTGLTSKPGSTPAVGEGENEREGTCDSSVIQVPCNEVLELSPALIPLANLNPHTEKSVGTSREPSNKIPDTVALLDLSSTAVLSSRNESQQEIVSLKKQALALKREGRQLEAKEKLRQAKLLERMLAPESMGSTMEQVQLPTKDQELEPVTPATSSAAAASSSTPTTAVHKSAGKDRMKLQQESLAHKRKALSLRRDGKTEAADVEFELAKSIEKQMEELGSKTEIHFAMPKGDDLGSVDDIFDPQLLAALKGLGWKESDIRSAMPEVRPGTVEKHTEIPTTSTTGFAQSTEKEQLEQKIKLEKIRALQLKRSGQQAEALEVLRGAKLLEKRLQSLC